MWLVLVTILNLPVMILAAASVGCLYFARRVARDRGAPFRRHYGWLPLSPKWIKVGAALGASLICLLASGLWAYVAYLLLWAKP